MGCSSAGMYGAFCGNGFCNCRNGVGCRSIHADMIPSAKSAPSGNNHRMKLSSPNDPQEDDDSMLQQGQAYLPGAAHNTRHPSRPASRRHAWPCGAAPVASAGLSRTAVAGPPRPLPLDTMIWRTMVSADSGSVASRRTSRHIRAISPEPNHGDRPFVGDLANRITEAPRQYEQDQRGSVLPGLRGIARDSGVPRASRSDR